jgi:hypothetical protein
MKKTCTNLVANCLMCSWSWPALSVLPVVTERFKKKTSFFVFGEGFLLTHSIPEYSKSHECHL